MLSSAVSIGQKSLQKVYSPQRSAGGIVVQIETHSSIDLQFRHASIHRITVKQRHIHEIKNDKEFITQELDLNLLLGMAPCELIKGCVIRISFVIIFCCF
jgi:hypothetical protein